MEVLVIMTHIIAIDFSESLDYCDPNAKDTLKYFIKDHYRIKTKFYTPARLTPGLARGHSRLVPQRYHGQRLPESGKIKTFNISQNIQSYFFVSLK